MAAQRQQPGGRARLTRRLTWLAVATGILRSRRFQGQVLTGAVVLAALAGLGRELRAHAWVRARAWARKVDQRAERANAAAQR